MTINHFLEGIRKQLFSRLKYLTEWVVFHFLNLHCMTCSIWWWMRLGLATITKIWKFDIQCNKFFFFLNRKRRRRLHNPLRYQGSQFWKGVRLVVKNTKPKFSSMRLVNVRTSIIIWNFYECSLTPIKWYY
jgi:hypothetical protein